MLLNQISIRTIYQHPRQLMFNKQVWCVQEEYWSHLKSYEIGKYKKVIVRVDNNSSIQKGGLGVDKTYSDVATINAYFDIEAFLSLEVTEKKKALLDLLKDCMIYLAEYYGWEKEPLIMAYKQCLIEGLRYVFKVKNKEFRSPNKDFIGFVLCEWEIENFIATAYVTTLSGQLIKKEIFIQQEPHLSDFIYTTNCKWDNPNTFTLYTKGKEEWSLLI
jgi:hypothetical protein